MPGGQQVDILQHLGCSLNVAYCFGAFEESSCVGLVLEMCEGGELWSRIKADHSERGVLPAPYGFSKQQTHSHCMQCPLYIQVAFAKTRLWKARRRLHLKLLTLPNQDTYASQFHKQIHVNQFAHVSPPAPPFSLTHPAHLKCQSFGIADAARLVREILRTVAQCHSRNVIIRDVKPDNFLFLSDDDQSGMRAIDFGLAEYCEPGQYLSDKVRPMESTLT